jgi:hypothetical protein
MLSSYINPPFPRYSAIIYGTDKPLPLTRKPFLRGGTHVLRKNTPRKWGNFRVDNTLSPHSIADGKTLVKSLTQSDTASYYPYSTMSMQAQALGY